MISLQQIEISQYCPEDQMTVAIHRRSSTMLSMHADTSIVFASRQSGGNRVWAVTGSFKLPSSPHIIGFYSLEAYNAFMILFEHNSSTRASFLDLSCNVINTWDLDNSCNCLVAGFDQNRKDVILASKNGDVKAFTVRLVKSIIHVIFRAQIRVPRKRRSIPIQIATQDVTGSFMILTATGAISCWSTAQLECLWAIEASRFRCPPTKLFPDKFGSDFAVLCVNKSNNKNMLEIWSPPRDFIECGANRFVRFEIPLKASVVSLTLETVGGDFGTALMVIQNNRHAQLWTLSRGLISQHCDLICTGDPTAFSSGSNDATGFTDQYSDCSQQMNYLKMFSLGQGCFTDGFGCPANEVLYLGLCESEFCLFALHSPTKGDIMWQETVIQQTLADSIAAVTGNKTNRVPVLAQFDKPESLQKVLSGGARIVSTEPAELEDDISMHDSYSLSDIPIAQEQFLPEELYGEQLALEQEGRVFAFTPAATLPSQRDKMRLPNSLVQVVKPRGLVVVSDNKALSFPQLHRLTRGGLLSLPHPQHKIPPKSELDIDRVSFAYRSERMVCITDLKEGFVFDMKPLGTHAEPVKPIRLEVDISPNAKCTAILACDVFIKLPPEVLLEEGIKQPLEGSGMTGSHVLAMFGDSEGKIFYSLCSHQSVLQQGFIRAHSKPIVALLSTGDCMKPIWKIGTSPLNKKSPQLKPTSMPGSGIISMDCSGEVKVWQPLFSNSGVLRSKQSQILSIYQLSWYLSGIISTREAAGEVDAITSCVLDPTCTTVYIGFRSGRMQQWIIPGITCSGSNSAQVIRQDVWESRKHGTAICSMRFWVHVQDTSVKARNVDFGKLNDPKLSKSAKYAAMITDNTSITSTSEGHIAYTLEELRKFAENSTFVTAAKDNTIVLWRLFVAKAVPLPSELADLKTQKLFTDCRFLEPIKCQIFTVSATPTEALCYPLQPQGGVVHWRLSVLVGGILINVAQGDKTTLFLPKVKKNARILADNLADSFNDNDSVACSVLEFDSADRAIIDQVDAMPVVCEVFNSQMTVSHMSLSGVPCRLSWKHPWHQDALEIPVQNVFGDPGPNNGDALTENVAIQLATLSMAQSPGKPRRGPTCTTGDITDHIRSPPKQYTVGASLTTPKKTAIKKIDKDALLKEQASNKGTKSFKSAASKALPSGNVNVEHAGIMMRVPASNMDDLDQITPGNHTKKYYVPKNMAAKGAAAITRTLSSFAEPTSPGGSSMVPNLRPPSPPIGGFTAMTSMTLGTQEGSVSAVRSEALNVEGHSSRTEPRRMLRIPSASGQWGETKQEDDMESLNDDISMGSASLVDMDDIENQYLFLQDEVKADPLIKSRDKSRRAPHIIIKGPKSPVVRAVKQPYRSAVLGSVPAPKESIPRGEHQNTRFVAAVSAKGTGTDIGPEKFLIPGESTGIKEDTLKFKMFINPVGNSTEGVPSRTNLHKFSTKQEVEQLSEQYSYFKNPRGYYEKAEAPLFYKKGAKEKGEEARDLKFMLEDMNTVMSDMDSDESGDDENAKMNAAKVDKIKDSMLSNELQLYSTLSAEEKESFLKKKRKDNQRVMRESKDAFKELSGLDFSALNKSPDGDDAAADNTEEASSLNDTLLKTKITSRKVMGWSSVLKAVSVGISMQSISDMISKSSTRKRHNNNPPANLNMKEFTNFAKQLNKIIAECEVPPIVETIIVDTLHDRVDISLQASKPGKANIVIYEDKAATAIPVQSDFRNLDTLLFRYEGCVSITEEILPHTSKVFLTLKGLDPATRYKIVVCAEHSEGKEPCRNSSADIHKTVVKFTTEQAAPESMDIEWGRLSHEQQCDEMIAATCDLETQTKAENAKIELPSSDDVEEWLTVVEETEDVEDLESAEHDDDDELTPYGITKLFLNWWTNNDPEFGDSSHRKSFLTRESLFYVKKVDLIHQCLDEKYLTVEQSEILKAVVEVGGDVTSLPAYQVFRSWLKGGRVMDAVYLGKKKVRRLEQFAALREELEERERSDEVGADGQPVMVSSVSVKLSARDKPPRDSNSLITDDLPSIVSVPPFSDELDEQEKAGSAALNTETDPDPENKSDDVEPEREVIPETRVSFGLERQGSTANVDDLVYVDDFDEVDPRLIQLRDRSARLVECSQSVEDAITLVNGLLMAQRHAEDEDLAVEDLERRRGMLRYEDVITIMAMKKLKELCEKKNIRPRDLDESNSQSITGASTFVEVPSSDLTPEEPPQATMLSLMGNAKRPLRSWEHMEPEERILEIQLACLFLDISELAVESGISIPNPEDGNILAATLAIPSRSLRWENYEKWYVGNELSDNVKKKRPSLARIMFADWEKKSIAKDLVFQEVLKNRPAASTRKMLEEDGSATASLQKLTKQKSNKRISSKRISTANIDMHNFTRTSVSVGGAVEEEDETVKSYESAINKDASLRCKFLMQLLKIAMKSRNLSMLRLLVPPAWPGRMHSQFMFPRLGLITPCYTEPVPRFEPNPSFSTESYSVAEVMLWFSGAELNLDDERMKMAEVEGKKRQAYLEWLAEEEARMIAGRLMMRQEDVTSHHLRLYTHSIEIDPPLIEGDSAHKEFVHLPSLPGEYSGLLKNDRDYDGGKGCGMDNEDEIEDILEQMRHEAESALRDKKELKKMLGEERKRKEEEEKRRLELQERDQRIEENKDRLLKLRKHLEHLKESRLQEKLSKELEIKENMAREEREEQERVAENERHQLIRIEQAKMDKEVRQMMREDETHHIQRDHLREFASMEHEDILGLMVREELANAEQKRLDRIRELGEVYQDFVPFRFDKSKIRVPHLHIDDDMDEEPASGVAIPDKIDWKLFKDRAPGDRGDDSEGYDDGCVWDDSNNNTPAGQYTINDVYLGNENNDAILQNILFSSSAKAARVSEALLGPDSTQAVDIKALKYWPRTTHTPATVAPLIWKGPDKSIDKSKQLRKKERPYTNFNSSEVYLQKVLKVQDVTNIVILEASADKTLHSLGLEKQLIRSFAHGHEEEIVRLPPLNVRSSKSATAAARPLPFKSSFTDPVIYRPNTNGLSIDSPSATGTISACAPSGPPSQSLVPGAITPVSNTYRVKTPKGKARKANSKSISTEKLALAGLIKQTTMRSLDPYYIEACKPGLRESDVVTTNTQKKALHVSMSMPEFKRDGQQQLHVDNRATTAIATTSMEGEGGGELLGADESDRTYPVNKTETEMEGVPPAEGPRCSTAAAENSHLVEELQTNASLDFEDDISSPPPKPKKYAMDDPVFRIVDRNVIYEPNNRIKTDSSYHQYEEYHPPFYRKPFGVKGHVKPIEEESFIVRARKSADALTAEREAKESREKRRLLSSMKEKQDIKIPGGEQQGLDLIPKTERKNKLGGTTVKSLHRDEFAALLRKSFEETSRQYDCGNVNFMNNKGL